MNNNFGIIEIGSNNTKTHIYIDGKVAYENNVTIEFKKNYGINKKIIDSDLELLYKVIEDAKKHTGNVMVYGCSIFRTITKEELDNINKILRDKYEVSIEVVTQEDEALLTAYGCYANIDYDGNMCIFIGGGGSIELIFVKNKEVYDHKFYDFGVVDVTNKFPSLREDFNTCTFEEVTAYVSELIGDIDNDCDVLVLCGGDHFYWYNNAQYELLDNTLYSSDNQNKMITLEMSDEYDKYALNRSLNEIKNRSDNPLWFDGSRAMKTITNVISHKIKAEYIIPTKINMEDGLAYKIINKN